MFLRQSYDHGNANTFFIEELLAPKVADSMVRPKKDRSRIQSSGSLEIGEDLSDFFIGLNPRIQILGPVLSKYGVIRVVRWQIYLVGIGMTFSFAVLSSNELELGENRMIGWCFLPVIAMIELARRDKVVIGLALVGDKVPSITEELGDQLDRLGNLVAVVVGRVAPPFTG